MADCPSQQSGPVCYIASLPKDIWIELVKHLEFEEIVNLCVAIPSVAKHILRDYIQLGLVRPLCNTAEFAKLSVELLSISTLDVSYCNNISQSLLSDFIVRCTNVSTLVAVGSALSHQALCFSASQLAYLKILSLSVNVVDLADYDDNLWCSFTVGNSDSTPFLEELHVIFFSNCIIAKGKHCVESLITYTRDDLSGISRKPFLSFAKHCHNLKKLSVDCSGITGDLVPHFFRHSKSNSALSHSYLDGNTVWPLLQEVILIADKNESMEALVRRLRCPKCCYLSNRVTMCSDWINPDSIRFKTPAYGMHLDLINNCIIGEFTLDIASHTLNFSGSNRCELMLLRGLLSFWKVSLPSVTSLVLCGGARSRLKATSMPHIIPQHVVELDLRVHIDNSVSGVWSFLSTLTNLKALRISSCSVFEENGGLEEDQLFINLEELCIDSYVCCFGAPVPSFRKLVLFRHFPKLTQLFLNGLAVSSEEDLAYSFNRMPSNLRSLRISFLTSFCARDCLSILPFSQNIRVLILDSEEDLSNPSQISGFFEAIKTCRALRYICVSGLTPKDISFWSPALMSLLKELVELRRFHLHFAAKLRLDFSSAASTVSLSSEARFILKNVSLLDNRLLFIDFNGKSFIRGEKFGFVDNLCTTPCRIAQIKPKYHKELDRFFA